MEAYQEYMTFKEQNNKEIRDIKKLLKKIVNTEDEVSSIRPQPLNKMLT